MLNQCHQGDCRDVLRKMIAEGVTAQMCVTSPPYWGLRDYGVDGQLGLEETVDCLGWATGEPCGECFICNQVEVFRLVREALADDGTLWLNMGDAYAGSWGAQGRQGATGQLAGRSACAERQIACAEKRERCTGSLSRTRGLKQKDLIGQPWRLAFALQANGWYLRQDIIWHKPNPMPESVKDRCTKSHEYIFLLSKSARYYFDQDAIREPASESTHPRRANNGVGFGHGYDSNSRSRGRITYKTPDGWDTSKGDGGHGSIHKLGREKGRKLDQPGRGTKNNSSMDEAMAVMPETRNKRSVWTVGSEPFKGAHFATFPTRLIEPCILAGSRPGDVVLDIYFGSGTTGQVAENLGRQWIGSELNPQYFGLQSERIRQRGLAL